jgi:hypothetical protein
MGKLPAAFAVRPNTCQVLASGRVSMMRGLAFKQSRSLGPTRWSAWWGRGEAHCGRLTCGGGPASGRRSTDACSGDSEVARSWPGLPRLLSPAADMPPGQPSAETGRFCCKSRRSAARATAALAVLEGLEGGLWGDAAPLSLGRSERDTAGGRPTTLASRLRFTRLGDHDQHAVADTAGRAHDGGSRLSRVKAGCPG